MSRSLLERRLADVSRRLKALRADLVLAEEQLAFFDDDADDARIRALVSETPLAEREHREAARHAEVMQRRRAELTAEIARLEETQDQLLDRLSVGAT